MTSAFFAAACITAVGCYPYQDGIVYGQSGDDGTATPGTDLTDAQIAGVMVAANDAVIESSQYMYTEYADSAVYRLAAEELLDHGTAQQRQTLLFSTLMIQPEDSALSDRVTQRGQDLFSELQTVDNFPQDRAYTRGMVNIHAALVNLINSRLLPSVDNPGLRAELELWKDDIEEHLGDARDMLGELGEDFVDAEVDVDFDANPDVIVDEGSFE